MAAAVPGTAMTKAGVAKPAVTKGVVRAVAAEMGERMAMITMERAMVVAPIAIPAETKPKITI
jgi:hypothetical protein